MKVALYIFSFLCLMCCGNEKGSSVNEICRFYLTTHSGSELGLTQIYDDGTIRVCTGYQEGEYQDTLLHLLFNKIPVRSYDKDIFSEYHAQVDGKMNVFSLMKLKNMLSAVSNEKHVIQESEDCVFFAWIGVIIAGEKEWSFYNFDIDGEMKKLYYGIRGRFSDSPNWIKEPSPDPFGLKKGQTIRVDEYEIKYKYKK